MSIVEIAKRVGVSCATVSRALNNPEKVRPDTLARIREACSEADFRPRVVPNNIKVVCLALSSPRHIYLSDSIIIRSAVRLLGQQDCQTALSLLSELDTLPDMFQRAFIGFFHEDDEDVFPVVRRLAERAPFVAIGETTESLSPNVTRIGSDHAQGMGLAMNHFFERKHRRVGFVASGRTGRGYVERFEAYRQIMEREGEYDDALVFRNDGRFMMEGLRRICQAGATAMFIAESELTLPTLYFLEMLGKETPRDVSIIAIEGKGGPGFLYPPLTCVVQPLPQLAELAVTSVMDQMAGKPAPSKRRLVAPYDLAVRESVRTL